MYQDNGGNPIIVQISRVDSKENFCKVFENSPETWTATFEIRNTESVSPGGNVYKPSAQIGVDTSGLHKK